MCEAEGLPSYEVSNHAEPGEESRHNLTYWRYGDYLGIGPGAHGRISLGGAKYSTATLREPAAWHSRVLERGNGCEDRSELLPREQAEEAVLMGLRLREGIDVKRLAAQTGYRPAATDIAMLEGEGLLHRDGEWLSATPQGRLVLNALIEAVAASLEETRASQY